MVAISDFSTFSQITYLSGDKVRLADELREYAWRRLPLGSRGGTYWNAIGVFLADALGLSLALLEGVLVLKLAEEVLA